MKNTRLPLVALALGLLIQLVLHTAAGSLPVLALLFASELGLLLNLAGAWQGLRSGETRARLLGALCLLLAASLAFEGYRIWQAVQAA